MHVKHILFDADGVLQDATQHWQPALQSALRLDDASHAKAVLDDIFEAETAALESEVGFLERLEAALTKWDRAGFVSETLGVLHAIEMNADVMRVVQTIRAGGIRCHVGSNQQALRARHMSDGLNYKSLFDTEFYSCFVGAAKPKLAFFKKVLAQLGCHASRVLFLDDRAENVAAAKEVGINATVFCGVSGADALRRELAQFGVFVDEVPTQPRAEVAIETGERGW